MSYSSQVQRLKAQLDEKNKPHPVPSHGVMQAHHHKARTQKERERIQIETAKKMASRFNLTYRALALSASKQAAENRRRDLEAAKSAKEAASRYQMTTRALQMSSTGTKSGKVNVLNLDHHSHHEEEDVSHEEYASTPPVFTDLSSLSIDVPPVVVSPEVVLETTVPEVVVVSSPAYLPATTTFQQQEEDDNSSVFLVDKMEEDDHLSRITEVSAWNEERESHDAFWMPDLSFALESGDDNLINVAVVVNFFQLYDPSRVGEAEALLKAHEGQEEYLMEALNMQYPDTTTTSRVAAVVDSQKPRPKSVNRVTGLSLLVHVEDVGMPTHMSTSVDKQGDSGYILNGVKKDVLGKWELNAAGEGEHAQLLRKRMLERGVKPEVIDAVVGDVSEMM